MLTSLKVVENLGLSFKNSRELNKIIDNHIPAQRPAFRRQEVVVAGKSFDIYLRDAVECIQALFGDPEFSPDLLLAPVRLFADVEKKIRVFSEMNTGNWWWNLQVRHLQLFAFHFTYIS